MKKLLAITSGLVAGSAMAFEMPALSVNSKVEFNTARVREGRREMDQNFVPSIEIGLPLFGAGDLYVGMDAYLPSNNEKAGRNEVAPYVGFSYDITDMFTLDLGYICHHYTAGKRNPLEGVNYSLTSGGTVVTDPYLNKKNTHEIYAGVMADVLLTPSLYFSYDATQKKANIEGAISYTYDLGSFGANGFAVDLGAHAGYSRVKKPYGAADVSTVIYVDTTTLGTYDVAADLFEGHKKGYFYVGGNADLVYSLNENTKARAGVAVSYNNAKKASWINNLVNEKKANVWFSSAVEFSF